MLWHSFFVYLPRLPRLTLGVRVDNLFTKILEIVLTARYTKREERKKFLDELSQKLATAGRMLGKWIQSLSVQ